MDKLEFQAKLTELVKMAQGAGGVLDKEQVRDFLKDLEEEQYELVYAFLAEHQIRVKGYLPPRALEAENETAQREEAVQEEVISEEEDQLQQLAAQSRFFAMYKEELDLIRPVSEEEEEELFRQVQAGDDQARQKLIEANLRLVAETALLYQDQGVKVEDLIQEGNLGLMMGIELAKAGLDDNWRKTVTESIMDAMEQAVYESTSSENLAHRSVVQSDLALDAVEKFKEEYGRKPTAGELAEELEMSEEELKDLLNLSGDAIELNGENPDKK